MGHRSRGDAPILSPYGQSKTIRNRDRRIIEFATPAG
jgi:hypothetical protein